MYGSQGGSFTLLSCSQHCVFYFDFSSLGSLSGLLVLSKGFPVLRCIEDMSRDGNNVSPKKGVLFFTFSELLELWKLFHVLRYTEH